MASLLLCAMLAGGLKEFDVHSGLNGVSIWISEKVDFTKCQIFWPTDRPIDRPAGRWTSWRAGRLTRGPVTRRPSSEIYMEATLNCLDFKNFFDVHKTELDALKIMVKTKMENAFIIDVPLVVDVGVGNNWLEAH